MTIKLIGNKLVLSEPPARDIDNALIVVDKNDCFKFTDIQRHKTEYDLPDYKTSEDIARVYLRVI